MNSPMIPNTLQASLASRGLPCAPSRNEFVSGLQARAAQHDEPMPAGLGALRIEAMLYSLRRARLFEGVAECTLRKIAACAIVKTIDKGEYLFRESDLAAGVYIVRNGIFNAHRVSADGRERVIHLFRTGESLAEGAVVSQSGYPADVRAVVRSEVILIPKAHLIERMRECPELALRLVEAMNRQLAELVTSLESLTLDDAETRVMNWLLDRCDDSDQNDSTIELGMTKSVLASELGTRHETLSRILGRLRDEGYLAVRGRRITVNDVTALREAFDTRVAGRR